jgi:uncharacterized protein (DUF302 family)
VAISQRAFPGGAETAYLARADVFADAVAAGSLRDGPILLVPSCGDLPEAVRNELARLDADQVFALGGDAAICDDVLMQAATADYTVAEQSGLVTFTSDDAGATVESVVARITSAVESGPASIVATIDHAGAASDAGLQLRPTTLLLVGNPAAGTPLMQEAQTAAIDLPQKLLVFEDESGQINVTYNHPDYLKARHNIAGQDKRLDAIAGTLAMLASGGSATAAGPDSLDGVTAKVGLIQVESNRSVAATVARITAAVRTGPASIVATIDHAQAAARAGLELRPTTVVLIGNPAAGTPLMQAEQQAGIDLPQKILVYEDAAGDVHVAYNDPFYIAARHGITGQDQRLQAISDTLRTLASGP